MGLLDGITQQSYYQGQDHGNYQFTSLDDIITQFQIAYVGEDKIIPKVKRADIAFHAQRALQELSFDTFKSIKAYQIDLPPSLQMILPIDYVNYTKISWTDSSGIKHPLYPTKHTSNPFQIKQEDDGGYYFLSHENLLVNGSFEDAIFQQGSWGKSTASASSSWSTIKNNQTAPIFINDEIVKNNSSGLVFKHLWLVQGGGVTSRAYCVWQKMDTRNLKFIDFSATATSAAITSTNGTTISNAGVVRVGITTTNPEIGWDNSANPGSLLSAHFTNPLHPQNPSPNYRADSIDVTYFEWNDGTSSQQEIENIDVSTYDDVWVIIQSYIPFTTDAKTSYDTWDHDGDGSGGVNEIYINTQNWPVTATPEESTLGGAPGTTFSWNHLHSSAQDTTHPGFGPTTASIITHVTNSVDSIIFKSSESLELLVSANDDKNSSTWNNYKSTTPSENNTDDYTDNTYWPNHGERFGLEPSHSQINGSFFIDSQRGKIHFSSNISGKTVILDYISDSLGTDDEMQVHKFAEEAMYKWIAYAILSTRINIPGQIVQRFKKEKFAETRKAKLRLSNIKLEELTQTLRGKSKHIKH